MCFLWFFDKKRVNCIKKGCSNTTFLSTFSMLFLSEFTKNAKMEINFYNNWGIL